GTGASMGELRLGRCGRFLLLAPLPRELLDLARGIDQALLAREERVAGRADLEPQLLAFRGPRGPSRATRAVNVDGDVIGMNACLHDLSARRNGPPAVGWRPRAPAVTANSTSCVRPSQGAGRAGRRVSLAHAIPSHR